jgi:alginate O-acetyltransferase complex protein AlgI
VLFNSYPFLFAYLPATFAAFLLLRHQRLRLLLAIGASYYFYAYAKPWFPALMAASTAIGFAGGRALESSRFAAHRKLVLSAGVAGVLGLLVYFKYAGFAGGYGADLVGLITGTHFPGFKHVLNGIVLPIGISFYTFEGISYLVDVYRGTIRAERNPLRYAFFISFFPHLIAGPIVRYGFLAPQLKDFYRLDLDRLRSGLMLFSLGLAKKVLVADGLAHWVNPLLARPSSLGAVEAWAAVFGFGFQIYFDFSAYSDMALGLARMFGIELPWNFDRPYRAANPSEFWRRWHVTLSGWLRDYLYIPLGGNRKGELRRDANLLTTMALGGLWHGASLNFIVWGLWHGGLLAGHRHGERLPLRLPRPASVALTFLLVSIGWVFFRMRTAHDIFAVFAGMFGAHGRGATPGHLLLYLAVASAIMWGLPEEWRWRLPSWGVLRVAALACLTAVAVMSIYGSHPFLYFAF